MEGTCRIRAGERRLVVRYWESPRRSTGMPDTPALQPEPGGPLAPVEVALRRTRRTASVLLVTASVAAFVAAGVALAMAVGLLDYFFRVPLWFRLAVWIAGIGGAVWAA